MVEVPNFDFREIEKRVGSIFNVALIDCEGCIKHIAATGILDQVHLILCSRQTGRNSSTTRSGTGTC